MLARKSALLAATLTPRKLANLGRIYASFHRSRRLGRSVHAGMPVKIGFEPTTHCNLRCPECPSGLRSFTRPTGRLSPALFRSTLDELAPWLSYLLLYFQGEPYLHPDFCELAAYAHEKGIYSATSTNGHYLSPEKARETVRSGISEVIISIDGVTQESYAAYRRGGRLDRVLEGARNLIAARRELRSLSPLILLQFLVVRPNEGEIPAIQALGRRLGADGVLLKTAQIYDFEHGSELIPTLDRYSRYRQRPDGRYEIKNPLENQCWKLWQGAEITWDGRVLPCCFDKDAQHEMGRLGEKSFTEIWQSAAYQHFRNSLLRSRAEIEMCKNCSEGTQVFT